MCVHVNLLLLPSKSRIIIVRLINIQLLRTGGDDHEGVMAICSLFYLTATPLLMIIAGPGKARKPGMDARVHELDGANIKVIVDDF